MKIKSWSAALFLPASFLMEFPAYAQPPETPLSRACGSETVRFDATEDASQHPLAQPGAGKAIVYVVGSFLGADRPKPLVKAGVDGSWVGAVRGNSYIFFSVQPGDHHLCVNWQSGFLTPSRLFALTSLTAEAGKTYYLRARTLIKENLVYLLDLDLVNNDEEEYLVWSATFSKSHAKR